ncbi:putative phosphodiesterase [Anaerosolibacter carboniphilus]|uniref:Putative phosphodiesterase n=1 Tax=Anaerosolibacter carboniphilus TaxID=1417629 RepID=A0A841L5U7_9FIRM|nr:metallophosphoesterase [Anaerosolibacter carboniphilus]MBB6217789.1 putative phosphodiesterase [Anaerosolibacter carboniphilus]
MKEIWKVLLHLTGGIYVPNELKDKSVKVMHISDTPSMIYKDLIQLIKTVKPHVLIHTGDIADEVKLEMLPYHVQKYKARANHFLRAISPFVEDRIIVTLGNHDCMEALHPLPKLEVYEESTVLGVYGIRISISHYYEKLHENSEFYMYGHCRVNTKDPSYLDGIDSINIIKVENKEIIKLLYPAGTDNYRLRRSKMGI